MLDTVWPQVDSESSLTIPLNSVSLIDCMKGHKLAYVSPSPNHGRVLEGPGVGAPVDTPG